MKFRIQLDFSSLLVLVATVSIAGGFAWGLLLAFYYLLSGDVFLAAAVPFAAVLIFVFQAIFTVLLGYPFYKWYCNRNRRQLLSGKMELQNETT